MTEEYLALLKQIERNAKLAATALKSLLRETEAENQVAVLLLKHELRQIGIQMAANGRALKLLVEHDEELSAHDAYSLAALATAPPATMEE